jgi:hypothetical protein
VKFLKTLIIACSLLGLTSVSTSFPDETGKNQLSSMPSPQNIWSVYKEIGGYSADTLGVVPDGCTFVLTDFVTHSYALVVELWGDNKLKLKIREEDAPVCNFTIGIPFHSGETIWVNNINNESIHLTVNGYFVQ